MSFGHGMGFVPIVFPLSLSLQMPNTKAIAASYFSTLR